MQPRRHEPPDSSIGALKIPLGLLSLWPPIAFAVYAPKHSLDISETVHLQVWATVYASSIPLALSFAIALMSCCSCCLRDKCLRRCLLHSELLLAVFMLLTGTAIVAVLGAWPGDFQVFACRIFVDVYGMALVHLLGAYWLHFWEGVELFPQMASQPLCTDAAYESLLQHEAS
mmetsp:Transcript_97358/g.172379  ORF Transcript_97358/g.172379 Transcript_97358/m.172379 type:complete len:173 (-) Transcript_97358:29-547(-)